MANYVKPNGTLVNGALNTQRAIDEKLRKKPVIDLDKISTPNDNGMLVTSTNVKIKAKGGALIGMIQSFTVSESRNVSKLQSIGIEGVTQAVPENYKGGTINAQRVALYGSRIYDALKVEKYDTRMTQTAMNAGYDYNSDNNVFKTLKDQRYPFEIYVETAMNGDRSRVYTETYIDCWISSYRKNYQVSNITISEQVTIAYAEVL